jgi:hypothetical protein
MSKKKSEILGSEILGDESIARSLVESEYPKLILPQYSIAPVDSIFPEGSITPIDSLFPVNSMDSEGSIDPQKIDFDSLTGMANNPTRKAMGYIYNGDVVLKDTTLKIDPFLSLGETWFRLTATIKVELNTPIPTPLINGPGNLTLQSTVWGIDGVGLDLFNHNDHLFDFPDQQITQAGYYTFQQDFPKGALNEDDSWFDRKDEIGVKISLVNSADSGSANKQVWTPIVTGKF